jgi:hypothetical protein
MLRTNLSTRPFYNDRVVRVGIAVGVVLAAALSAFNIAQIITLNERNSDFVGRAEAAEARANELRGQAEATRKSLDRTELSRVQAASREANLLIDRRVFSWTDLFNRFEETLPADVRIAAVQPQVDDDGRMMVAITVIARRVEELEAFSEQLERTGAFRGLISRTEIVQEDGTLRSVLQGYYGPQAAAAVQTAPSSDSNRGSSNGTPGAATPGNAAPRVPSAPGGAR